jgi:hypothetical protein
VLRECEIVEDNVKAFLEWRKRTAPDAYNAAIHELAKVLAEIPVRELLAENAEQESRRSSSLTDTSSETPE